MSRKTSGLTSADGFDSAWSEYIRRDAGEKPPPGAISAVEYRRRVAKETGRNITLAAARMQLERGSDSGKLERRTCRILSEDGKMRLTRLYWPKKK